MKIHHQLIRVVLVIWFATTICKAQDNPSAITPLVRVVDLNVGESVEVALSDGSTATVKLLDLQETRDEVCFAVRRAEVAVEVNGKRGNLVSATYHRPQTVGNVQIDCSITKGYNENGDSSFWGLDKDARLRLWPADSPLLRQGTFTYPVKQKWFATDTQMANDPVYVDGGERAGERKIYYHSGLDIGGSEGLVEVVAATDAIVVSVGEVVLEEHRNDTPVSPRYDVVYLLDGRGWYYRYSHLKEIDKKIVPGRVVTRGDRIGLLGKEGGSGGWSHLHFEIKSRQPSGKWGTQEGYAFLWEAYQQQYKPKVIAVARPHHVSFTGDSVTLDGSRSWCESGDTLKYEWKLSDGSTAATAQGQRQYDKPGRYSEILKVTDKAGNVAYDFAVVVVVDREHPDRRIPSIHPNYYPTQGIRVGDSVTFKVRTFNTTFGNETWDFGDGSPPVEVQSDGNADKLAPDGYAVTTHQFAKSGDYVVRVSRTNEHGVSAVGHLHVHIEPRARAGNALKVSSQHELFIDDHWIKNFEGLQRKLHQPRDIDSNPVIVSEEPWEHRRIPFGSVLWIPEENKFRCWYLTLNIYDSRPGFRGYRKEHHVPIHEAAYICYAESIDGVNWTKPDLGLHDYRGSKHNNIVLKSPGTHFDSISVMHLPHDDQWPYRMMAFIGRWPYRDDLVKKQWGDPPPFEITRHGHYAFGSKDGIHWHELNDNKPVLRAHDRSMFWWDSTKGIFAGAAKQSAGGKRAQAYAWSRDMIDWTITSDWILQADQDDHPEDEAEAAYCFPYGSQWIGFAEMRRVRRSKPGVASRETKINWALLTSRDGRRWDRPFRELFFADAAPKTWRYQVFKIFANPRIERDGRLLIYYGGKTGTVSVETGMEPFQALCLATLRKDGFVSLTAGEAAGHATTKVFTATGTRLMLNADVHETGAARVEVLDESGRSIDGFGLENCKPLRGNDVEQVISWSSEADWSSLSGRDVSLRIHLREADLYSFWVKGST